METLLSGRALRDGGFVSLLALTVASVASATLVVFLWSHAAAWLRAWRMLYKLPGPPILIPMAYAVGAQISLGNLSKCMDYNAACVQFLNGFVYSLASTNKPLGKAYVGLWPFVLLYTAEGAEALLKSTTVLNKALLYKLLNSWLGTGLLTSPRSKWRGRRKLLTPAFHFKLLDEFLPVMTEHADAFVRRLNGLGDRGPMNVVPLMSGCTLDIICETAMGTSVDAQGDEGSPYFSALKVVSGAFITRVLTPWNWVDAIYFASKHGRDVKKNTDYLHRFTQRIIRTRKENYVETPEIMDVTSEKTARGAKRLAFLDLLLSCHMRDQQFTEEGIREEVDTFMFEGHDTTSVGLSFTLYLLGLYKEAQEKVHQELDAIFGEDRTRPATEEDLKQMKYLECVIKESHRLYPPVPIVARRTDEDMEIAGYQIPPGTTLALFMYTLHRDERWFPEPEEFRPERFFPENSVGRPAYAYVPFSAGPRNCIGQRFAMMEEKVVISTILRHFRLHSPDERDTILITWELVLKPLNALNVHFLPKKKL
ncbi:cytochrome P450 4V2 [Ixodes scapularis]